MVGAIGFEPTTPCSRSRCATRLRYAPTCCGWMPVLGETREPWIAYRHKQFSRDLPGNAVALRPGRLPDIMKEYESQPGTRLLLPDDFGRPVSPVAISSPLASTSSF